MRKILLALMFAFSGNAFATNISPSTQQEIQYLFRAFESYDCILNRNGSWYAPTEASPQLQKKLKYQADRI
jgi:hypothetical protein